MASYISLDTIILLLNSFYLFQVKWRRLYFSGPGSKSLASIRILNRMHYVGTFVTEENENRN